MKLPPLLTPYAVDWSTGEEFRYFTECQIHDYALSVAEAVKAEAVRILDSVNNYDNPMTANDCADAIKSLEIET